jgi:hypothetical protein
MGLDISLIRSRYSRRREKTRSDSKHQPDTASIAVRLIWQGAQYNRASPEGNMAIAVSQISHAGILDWNFMPLF